MVLYPYISQFEQISFQLATVNFTSLGWRPVQAQICGPRTAEQAGENAADTFFTTSVLHQCRKQQESNKLKERC